MKTVSSQRTTRSAAHRALDDAMRRGRVTHVEVISVRRALLARALAFACFAFGCAAFWYAKIVSR